MAVQTARGAIQWLSTDALNATYPVSGLGFQPKAILFIATSNQSASDANTQTVSKRMSVGMMNGVGMHCVGSTSVDAGSSGDCGTARNSNCVASQNDAGGAIVGRLTGVIDSDGFTLTNADIPTGNFTVLWLAIGGSDITVAARVGITEPAATGNQDYAATGFVAGATDQAVILAGVQSTAADNSAQAGDSGFFIGFATGGNDADNVVVCGNADDGSPSMDTDGYCKTGECLAMIASGGGDPDARAKLTQFNTDGFRLNWLARAVTGRQTVGIAIKGGTWKAGALSLEGQTANATATLSGMAAQPVGVIAIGRMSTECAAGTSVANDRLSIGMAVSTTDRAAAGFLDEDGTGNTEIDMTLQYDQLLAFPSTGGALQSAYDLDAFTSDGLRVIVDTAGGVASEWVGVLAFGSAAAADTTMAAAASGICSTAAALTTAITMAASGSGICSATASLTTAIRLIASATGVCSTASDVTTAIRFLSAATGICSVRASLTPTFDTQQTSAHCEVSAALTTAITLASTSSCVCAATCDLSTAIPCASAAAGICSTGASLTTAISLQASATGVCSATAGATTAIRLASASSVVCSTTCALSTSIQCAASASGICSVTFGLSTAITMAASCAGICSTTSALSTAVSLAASAIGVCSTVAEMGGDTVLRANASCVCSTAAAFSTAITCTAGATGICSTTCALTTAIRLAAEATGRCQASGDLTTASPFAAAATGTCATTASLTTAIDCLGAATGICGAAAALTTAIRLAASASGRCQVACALTTQITLTCASTSTCSTTSQLTTGIALAGACSGILSGTGLLSTAIALAGQPTGSCATAVELQLIVGGGGLAGEAWGSCSTNATLRVPFAPMITVLGTLRGYAILADERLRTIDADERGYLVTAGGGDE